MFLLEFVTKTQSGRNNHVLAICSSKEIAVARMVEHKRSRFRGAPRSMTFFGWKEYHDYVNRMPHYVSFDGYVISEMQVTNKF